MTERKVGQTGLQLPVHCFKMGKEEMRCIEGGSISIDMQSTFLNKQICLNTAEFLLAAGAVKNMTQLQIAQEIYGHAVAYYAASGLQGLGIDNGVIQSLISDAHPIDIVDGGDTLVRQAAFAIIWDRVNI